MQSKGLFRLKAFVLILVASFFLYGCFEEKTKIIDDYASYSSYNKYFSFSLAIDGNYAIVGVPEAYNCYNFKTGAAYIAWRGNGDWSSYPNRVAPTDLENNDFFGFSVSISGDYAIIGASHEDIGIYSDAGSAYIYGRYSFGYNENLWYRQAKLFAPDSWHYDYFGRSVSISGDYAIIGASGDDNEKGTNAGAVYVYKRYNSDWFLQAKIVPSDGASNDNFGQSVSINGDYAIIGAPSDDNRNGTDAGAIYIYERIGSSWIKEAKFIASAGASFDYFGWSVSINTTCAIAGARYNDNKNGANAGAAYVYRRYGGDWIQQEKLIASDGKSGDKFGNSVSIGSSYAMVGAPYNDNDNGTDSGAVYVYLRVDDDLLYLEKLTSSDGATGDLFGFSVSVSNDHAVLGALYDDNKHGTDAGSAYIFEAADY